MFPRLISTGVNTGFGGSADTRTKHLVDLQKTIVWELHSGVLPVSGTDARNAKKHSRFDVHHLATRDDPEESNLCMPISWTRAAIVARINSLASGYSGVRPAILEILKELLRKDIIPRIPLRGSISASGDLIPLSYIGGVIQGDPGIEVWVREENTGNCRITTADVALRESGVTPLQYAPKEGLSLVNGTAFSTGVAALAIHDAHCLAVASQILTAMSVEALNGSKESFDPIFGLSRPHPGQIESAQNIYGFLTGSKLIKETSKLRKNALYQDRYSIRTASQWIGPVLEDLLLANQQIQIECNSSTDNPLIDVQREQKSWNGGNFQARAITSAMEKTRLGLQALGQMLFAQCTELVNPRLNFGLPPNLTADQPSESFLMKPLDVLIASLQSELGYLSNSAGSHIQSAEMGNQALNSLALISARYTHTAVEVLCQLIAAHLLALCQAFDLRAMHGHFLQKLKPEMIRDIEEDLGDVVSTKHELHGLQCLLWDEMLKALEQTTSMDSTDRFTYIFKSLQPHLLDVAGISTTKVGRWTDRSAKTALKTFENAREEYSRRPDARRLLGVASNRMYSYIRDDLAVPFLRKSHLDNVKSAKSHSGESQQSAVLSQGGNDDLNLESDHATREGMHPMKPELASMAGPRNDKEQESTFSHCSTQAHVNDDKLDNGPRSIGDDGNKLPSIGHYISVIYEALRSGELCGPMFQCLKEAQGT